MRKNVVALILLLPMIFVLAVFSSVRTVSLGVPISANGIEILERPENDVYRIDLAAYENDYSIKARVTPESASNRDYVYRVDGGDAVTVDAEGKIHAHKTGEARISVVSKDGGYEDSVKAVVFSTEPYDFTPRLSALGETEEIALKLQGTNYGATIPTGQYRYAARTAPEGVIADLLVETKRGFAAIDRLSGTILFPFSGETELSVSMPGKIGGEEIFIEKRISLQLEKFKTETGLVVNGGNPVVVLSKDSEGALFYVEGPYPSLEENEWIAGYQIEEIAPGNYAVETKFREGEKRDFVLALTTESGAREEVQFSFTEFDFTVRSALPVQSGSEASVLLGTPVSFFAVPSAPSSGISYVWKGSSGLRLEPDGDGSECRVTALELGEHSLKVQAMRGGVALDIFKKTLTITAVRQLSAIQFAFKTDLGLGKSLTLAGKRYEGGKLADNSFDLSLLCYDSTGSLTEGDVEYSTSNETVAVAEGGKLIPKGTGQVRVKAEWKGNESFGAKIEASAEIFVIEDAVACTNSAEVYRAAAEKRKIVLMGDIRLGTDERGEPLTSAERERLLGSMDSTYNVEYYKNRGQQAKVKYALEFTNDVFGNGYSLNAELLSAAQDGSGQPIFFRGPLDFVRFGEVASVAAQDNICFLIRTDDIRLYNVNLLGCGDDMLLREGGSDLSGLNTVGTTLEINASSRIENCRIRNGRTVLRIYGGNRSGDGYFSENLEELKNRADPERIKVKIFGCILSQGREFLLKLGSNAALRAGAESAEPDLLDGEGKAYPAQSNALKADENFYREYVMTDVTLEDSVLETSGFFTIGVESNFSGELLQAGVKENSLQFEGWRGTGGTSAGSILRLRGDVRLYDWKELRLIDSSTLIATELPELKLDIPAMLEYVCAKEPARFGEILDEGYVHGGIAFYGGGKNYGQLDLKDLDAERSDFGEYRINISVLQGAEGSAGYLGRILPSAAGTQDFRFYLYGREGQNSRAKQKREESQGLKYAGIGRRDPI